MSEERDMTPAQEEAITKAWAIMTEHFDRVLVVVDWETDDKADADSIYWHGGHKSAIGMAHYAMARISATDLPGVEP